MAERDEQGDFRIAGRRRRQPQGSRVCNSHDTDDTKIIQRGGGVKRPQTADANNEGEGIGGDSSSIHSCRRGVDGRTASSDTAASVTAETVIRRSSNRDTTTTDGRAMGNLESPTATSKPDTSEDAIMYRGGGRPSGDVVYRDRHGRAISQDEWLDMQRKNLGPKGARRIRPVDTQVLEWGKGLVQKNDLQEAEAEAIEIASQPMSRYEIDEKLDAQLRQKIHWGDPMAGYADSNDEELSDPSGTATRVVEGKHTGSVNGSDEAATGDTAESKDVVNPVVPPPSLPNVHQQPTSRFPHPPNRFDIKAGYRWDGVVRGNDFDVKLIHARNMKAQEKETAYKWSVEDM